MDNLNPIWKGGDMMEYSKNIEQILTSFKKEKGNKKAFLFHQGQVFYFYDYEFCKIDYVKLSLSCREMLIEYQLYNSIIDTIFIWVKKERVSITTDQGTTIYDSVNRLGEPFKLALSYGILHDEERKRYLSGFVYINSQLSPVIYSSYFTEPDIVALLEVVVFQKVSIVQPALHEENLIIAEQAEKINKDSVKALSKLYLKGKSHCDL